MNNLDIKVKSKPKTEIELMEYQRRWLDEGDQKAYQEMFKLIVAYARSFALKMTKNKIYLNPELVYDKSMDATVKFMEQYQQIPGYRINDSFGGYLQWKVLEALYGPKTRKHDDIGSLNAILSVDKQNTEMEDLQEIYNFETVWDNKYRFDDPSTYLFNTEDNAIKTILTVFTDVYEAGMPLKDIILLLNGILLYIRKARTLESFKKSFFSEALNSIFDLCLVKIHNRLANID